MEPIFTDEELKELLKANWMLGGSADDLALAKVIRGAVEDKLRESRKKSRLLKRDEE